MIAYAAVDIRGGRCVQLVGGRPSTLRISLPDPEAVAARWEDTGFAALHVVDLDAALAVDSNADHVEAIIAAATVPVQVGGGVRRRRDVERWLSAGATRVIVGTRAVADPDWLATVSEEHPDRIVVAADFRDGKVLSHGWQQDSGVPTGEFLTRLRGLPIAGVLVTDVGREGRLAGIDTASFRDLVEQAGTAVTAAGGIASLQDLRDLSAAGLEGAVIGMALYTGAVDPAAAAQEFSS